MCSKINQINPRVRELYFSGAYVLIIEKVARMVIGFGLNCVIARFRGPDEYGQLNYAVTIFSILGVLVPLGINSIIIREIIKCKSKKNQLIISAMATQFVVAIAILSSLLLIQLNLVREPTEVYWVVGILCIGILFKPFDVLRANLESDNKVVKVAIVDLISFAFFSFIKIITVLKGGSIMVVAIVSVVELIVVSACWVILGLNQTYLNTGFKIDFNESKKLVVLGWPMLLSGAAIMISMRIDQIIIAKLVGNSLLGQYAAAAKLSEAWYFLPMAVNVYLIPKLTRLHSESIERYRSYYQNVMRHMMVICFVLSLFNLIFAKFIINIIFGYQFGLASTVYSIHIWTLMFVSIGTLSGSCLIIEGLQLFVLYQSVFGMVINILLNYLLITLFGIVGAAVTALLAQILSAYIFDVFSDKTVSHFRIKTNALRIWQYNLQQP